MQKIRSNPTVTRFPDLIKERLLKFAAESGISRNAIVVEAVRVYLDGIKNQNPLEALNSSRSASKGFDTTSPKEASGHEKS